MRSKFFEKINTQVGSHPTRSTAIILALIVLVFLSPGFFQGRFLAPVDTFHFVAPYLDITTQMLPWYHLSAELIHSGHWPLWNIYSGNGLPLLANMQSAVFFPLTWVFYLFSARWALLIYSFLKLWLMGLFMYWYLKELKLSYFSSLLGSMMFAFCGANVIWFLWPLTNVLLILPLSFLLIEKYFSSGSVIPSDPTLSYESERVGEPRNPLTPTSERIKGSLHSPALLMQKGGIGRDDRKTNIKYALLLAPVTALGLLAGHPQTFFYVFCAVYCYAIFKSFCGVGDGLKPSPAKQIISNGLKQLVILSLIFFLGFIISAAAVLPFLEYLRLSANLGYRSGFSENPFFLPKSLFLANLIPDFYGNTGVKNFSYLLVPNYGELALGYVGLSGLALSLFAFGKKIKNEIIFFALAALCCLALIYHAPIIYALINRLPGFNLNYNNRLLYLWAFFISILGAFGLERFLNNQVGKKQFNFTWISLGILSIILIAANRVITKGWQFAHNLDWRTVSLWQDALILAFLVNFAVAFCIIKYLPKKSALAALFFLVFLETTVHGMVFMKTSKPENFYPATPAFEYLKNQFPLGYFRVFSYGDNLLPNIGTWYGINELNDHDTIYLESNKQLKQYVANYNYSPEYTFDQPNFDALRFLSVKYLLYPASDGFLELKKYPADLSLAYKDTNFVILALNNPLPRAFVISASNTADLAGKLAEMVKNPLAYPIIPVTNFKLQTDGTESFAYNAPANAFLVTTDNYYPDWSVKFGSGPAEQSQNAFGLRAAPIPARQGTAVVSFHPKNFKLGLEISAAALLVWLGLFFALKKKNIT